MSDGGKGPAAALLAALKGRGQGFERAYESLRRELEGYARSLAGARAGQADFQPESIVASALSKGMQQALADCRDDGHLAGWLKQAVRHELLDRVEKRRPGTMPGDASDGDGPGGATLEPHDPHAGPSTEIAGRELVAADREALARFFARLDEVAIEEGDRALLELYVVERLAWDEIAERSGTTVGAARVAMKRLRDRLLPRIFAPIRARLSPEEWTVAEALFVRRLTAERAGAELALEPAAMRRTAIERVIPAILAEWGGASAELILRLTGHRR